MPRSPKARPMPNALSRRALLASLLATTAMPQIAYGQAAPSGADPAQPIISDWPRRQPAFAAGGMVASQEALATRVGVEVLEQGGNAVDAAVAVGFALAVTLPRAGNIGGGGFMIVHRADRNATVAVDFRETAPASMKKDVYLNEKGEADLKRSQDTGLGIGVPGTVAGMALALEKHGSGRFTLAQLVSPAVQLAADGFMVGDDLAFSLKQAENRFKRFEASARIFMTPDGGALPRGANLMQVDLAHTLGRISREGPKAFLRRRDRAEAGGGGERRRRPVDARRSEELPRHRARGGARHLSRARDRLDAAALLRRRASGADPQHPRGLRHEGGRRELSRRHPSLRRGLEARLRRPQRISGRPGFREGAGEGTDVQALRRDAARADRPCQGARPAPASSPASLSRSRATRPRISR